MASRTLLKGALTAAVLVPILFAAPALAGQSADKGGDPSYWRVPVSSPGQVQQLRNDGFDVAESEVDEATVVGDSAVAKKLRDKGFVATRVDAVYKGDGRAKPPPTSGTFYGGYRTVATHEQHLNTVAAAYPALATQFDIGDSWLKTQNRGGHDIKAICLTRKQPGDCQLSTTATSKPKFLLMGQIHARELTTGELAWRWIDYLTQGYGTDAEVTAILDTTEVWVVPIANPDGVDKVASGGNKPLLQRKNVNPTTGSCTGTQIGVDLNRNSTFKWGNDSTNPCSETFQGPAANSEPEVDALEGLFRAIFPDQRGAGDADAVPSTAKHVMVTLHSYGNYIIVPWGWSLNPSPNDVQLRALGAKMAAHNGYTVGTNTTTVGYRTSGTTDDFTYGELGLASVTFEVGGTSGQCGGFLPSYSCQDNFWNLNKGAFIAAAKAAPAPYQQ